MLEASQKSWLASSLIAMGRSGSTLARSCAWAGVSWKSSTAAWCFALWAWSRPISSVQASRAGSTDFFRM